MSTVTGAVVEHARRAPFDPVRTPALVRTLVDTVGVALPGGRTHEYAALERWSVTAPSPGSSVVWGRAATASAARAALLNGTAAHALDFDDASPTSPLHPGAVLWPAVLADAGPLGCTWPEVLAAVDVGQTVLRSVAALLGADHYARGFHTTATAGRIAATAALVRLHGCDDDTARNAIGIAATLAGGLRANFGTATKPLHAGLAARDAVEAVAMAQAGVDATSDALDGPTGMLAALGDPPPAAADRVAAELARWTGAWPQDTSVKRYPSCYGTHRAVDAALEIRERAGEEAAGATLVVVEIHPTSLRPLLQRAPRTATEAKFSLEHAVASALVDGHLSLGSFAADAVVRPDVVALRERVAVVPSDLPPGGPDLGGQGYARVRVRTGSSQFDHLVTVVRGDARDPISDTDLDRKLLECAHAAGWSPTAAGLLLASLRGAATTTSTNGVLAALRRDDEEDGT